VTSAAPSPDVLVIGAGITGTATALALAEAGARVEVLERYAPAAMASGWTLAGVRQSGRDPAELPLARAAVRCWQRLDERLDAETGYRQGGNLRLARDEDEVTLIRELVASQGAAGLALELVDGETLREIAPALSPDIVLASWCPSDGHADPHATVAAYAAAARRLGVRFRSGTAVERLLVQGGRFRAAVTANGPLVAERCVLAAGIQTNDLLADIAPTLPIRTPVVTVVQSEPLPPLLGPVIGVANADLAVRQQLDGRLRMTSGAETRPVELREQDGRPRVPIAAGSLAGAIARVSAVLPIAAEASVARLWGGLLDVTPDALPVLDRVPEVGGLVVAAGFSGHGFGIGPAVAEGLAALALDRAPPLSLDAFRFERFVTFDEAASGAVDTARDARATASAEREGGVAAADRERHRPASLGESDVRAGTDAPFAGSLHG